MKASTRVFVGAGVTTAVLAVGTAVGVGIASADPPPSPSSPTPTASKHDHQRHKGRRLFQRVEHGQLTLVGPKHRVVDIQRGTVSSIGPTNIKISSKDGYVAGYVINSKTVIRERTRGRKPVESTTSAIKTGDRVRLIATQKGKSATADRIAFRR